MHTAVRRHLVASATAFALVAAAVLLAGQGAQAIGVSGGRIDFAHVERGGVATATFVVRADASGTVDVEIAVENDPDGALAVTPATATIPSGGTVHVMVALAVPADADPGRHQPAVVVAETTPTGGTVAGGAVRVPVMFVVEAVDVTGVYLTDDGLLQVRVVNGHPTARTAELDMSFGSPAQAHATGPGALAPGASWLVDWTPDWSRVADGTHTMYVTGSATGGPQTEPFAAAFEVTVSGSDRRVGAMTPGPTAPTAGGGGGGGAPGGAATPTAPGEPAAAMTPGPARAPTTTGGTMPPLPPGFAQEGLRGGAGPDAVGGATDDVTAAPDRPSPASLVFSVMLALAALAAVGYGLRRAFKNHGGKRPPSGAS